MNVVVAGAAAAALIVKLEGDVIRFIVILILSARIIILRKAQVSWAYETASLGSISYNKVYFICLLSQLYSDKLYFFSTNAHSWVNFLYACAGYVI